MYSVDFHLLRGSEMDKFYLVFCGLMVLFLPHLSHESVSTMTQISLQFLFVFIGWAAFKTFTE